MANVGELNARQRKQVHMHSTIFDDGGPTNKSVYLKEQQRELHDTVRSAIRTKAETQPKLELPSAADIQCTQNAGHGVVMPSGGGVAAIPRVEHGRAIDAPRTSGRDVLVTDGEPMSLVKAAGRNDHIPKEFWSTSVNLSWCDPRIELSRKKDHDIANRKGLDAKQSKMQELSSDMFGKERLTSVSTTAPKKELLSETTDRLKLDSAFEKRPVDFLPGSDYTQENPTAASRMSQNLTNSMHNTLPGAAMEVPDRMSPRGWGTENECETLGRRRTEKNYSDLFDSTMGQRREVPGREEIIATGNCSFLDTRCEIGTRNKEHWRRDEEYDRPGVDRKAEELDSNLNGYVRPSKPDVDAKQKEVVESERVCWDTKDTMQLGAEVARRAKTRGGDEDRTAAERKHEFLASNRVREGFGTSAIPTSCPRSPRGPRRLENPVAAKDVKLASLQSSIMC